MMFGKNPGTDETWKRIPEGSIGAELGVWKGDSSEKFLRRAKHVHLVDEWAPAVFEGSNEFGGYDAYLKRYSELTGEATTEGFVRYYNKIHEGVVKRFTNKPVTITPNNIAPNDDSAASIPPICKIIKYKIIGDKTGKREGIIISLIAALVNKSTNFP